MENNNQYAKGTSFMLVGAIMVVVSYSVSDKRICVSCL